MSVSLALRAVRLRVALVFSISIAPRLTLRSVRYVACLWPIFIGHPLPLHAGLGPFHHRHQVPDQCSCVHSSCIHFPTTSTGIPTTEPVKSDFRLHFRFSARLLPTSSGFAFLKTQCLKPVPSLAPADLRPLRSNLRFRRNLTTHWARDLLKMSSICCVSTSPDWL